MDKGAIMKRILVFGADGYLGWPTCMHFASKGFEVCAVDNYFRRRACLELDIKPLIEVPSLVERSKIFREKTGLEIKTYIGDICDYAFLSKVFKSFKPNTVVHYAEQPSAPYSMMNREKAVFTLTNNLVSTFNIIHAVKEFNPHCHIIKLGTMGVYGTPNINIEEGYLEVEHKGRKHTFLYPKTPGSLYHLTKSQDGDMLYFYCRMWDIRVTDLNQGPVYGIITDEMQNDERLFSIFNYDDIFGTVLNRFMVQAITGYPLTVYGKGGQTRGYLNIKDTIACVDLAANNPVDKGKYRIFNQVVEIFTVNELAEKVQRVGNQLGLNVKINSIKNPRREAEEHYYNPIYTGLKELGLNPHLLTDDVLAEMLELCIKYKKRVNNEAILPKVLWG